MATLFNNTEITNVFFNGTELDKIYFNGVLVFEKGGKYLRRIMVGDNLKGVTIYNDIKPGYYSILNEYYPNNYGNENFIVPSVMAIPFSDAKSQSSNGYTYNVQGNMINFYNYYNGTENITPFAKNNNSDYIVSTVVDTNPSYKHLFIEDEYIRPLKVGDVITRNTKFYFTIPDDIFSKTNIGANPIRIDGGSTLSVIDYSSPKCIMFYVNNSISTDNYVILYENEKITKNKSSMIVSPVNGNYFEGTVSRIESNSLVYNMTFVDVRTLG